MIVCDTPFLIIGAGSSGTTLLSVLLDNHPEIACGPEISVFNKDKTYANFEYFKRKLPDWIKYGLSTNGQSEYRMFFLNIEAYHWRVDEIVNLAKNSTHYIEFFNAFYSRVLERRNKKIWGEKTGSNCYCIKEFLKIYPKAKIIHIVRDGRDSACSVFKRAKGDALRASYHAATHWLYNVSASYSHRLLSNYLYVKYESLVRDPVMTLKLVCNHIGVQFEKSIFDVSGNNYWLKHQGSNMHKSWGQSPLSGKITGSSIGRYKEEMDSCFESLFWNVRLTAAAKKKLNVSFDNSLFLMKHFGYLEKLPDNIPDLTMKYKKLGLMEQLSRTKRELLLEKRLLLPLFKF